MSATVLAAFTVVFVALEVIGYTQKSATWDEPIHLTAGYAALARNDYRVDPSHPPFLRMWAALPLLAMHRLRVDTATIDRASIPVWFEKAYEFSHQFMYVENDADWLLYAARFMVVVWGVVLGILLFGWMKEWLGFLPAVCALVFYTIEPNIAAHASLVTTDFGVTCFIFGTVYFLWRTCRRFTRLNVAGLTMFFALAIVTKFSGLVLAPIVVLLLAIAVSHRSTVSVRRACELAGLLMAAAFIAIWATCGFRYAPSASEAWLLRLQDTPTLQQRFPDITSIASWIDTHHLLPNVFTQGLLFLLATAQNRAFLAGMYSTEGWWYYFPVAFLIKTPIALIVLLFGGLFVYAKRRRQLGLANEAFVVLPIVVYLGFAMMSGFNIGLRHILPIYPFVLLIAVAAAERLIATKRRVGRVALATVTMCWLAEFASVYPNTLTFFNRFVGGPRHGFEYLADSNLGWGAHLKSLKRWMDGKGVSHINLAYFGTADPAYYHIDCTYLPGSPSFAEELITRPRLPGYVAISKTVLTGVYLQPRWRLFYRPFQDQAPVAEIGNSIRVYWVNRWPEASEQSQQMLQVTPADIEAHAALGDALLFAMHWPTRAILHYRQYLQYRPNQTAALTKLGIALGATGKTDEAIQTLRRVVDVDPTNGEAISNLANELLGDRHVDEAALYAQRAVTLRPGDPAAHDLLGRALAAQGRLEEATMQFEHSLQIDPTYAEAREHLRWIQQIGHR